MQIERDLNEAVRIRESLGDDVEADAELSRCLSDVSCLSGGGSGGGGAGDSLRGILERVQGRLVHWRARRAEKLSDYEAVMHVTQALKAQLGVQHTVAVKPDLSRANLDFLRMEQERLKAEKVWMANPCHMSYVSMSHLLRYGKLSWIISSTSVPHDTPSFSTSRLNI